MISSKPRHLNAIHLMSMLLIALNLQAYPLTAQEHKWESDGVRFSFIQPETPQSVHSTLLDLGWDLPQETRGELLSMVPETSRGEDPFPVPLQILVGWSGALAGGVAGAFVMNAIELAMFQTRGDWAGATGAILGGASGLVLGSAIGVHLLGRTQTGAKGSFGSALGGATLGVLSAGVFAVIVQAEVPILAGVILLPAIGATVGYNLSRRKRQERDLLSFAEKLPANLWASPNLDGGFSFGFNKSF